MCLKYKQDNFLALDVLRRRVKADLVEPQDFRKVYAVLPTSGSFQDLHDGRSVLGKQFQFILKNNSDIEWPDVVSGCFKIFSQNNSNSQFSIQLENTNDQDKTSYNHSIQIKIYQTNKNQGSGSTPDVGISKKSDFEVLKRALVNSIEFRISDYLKQIEEKEKPDFTIQPSGSQLHVQDLELFESPQEGKKTKMGYGILNKVFDLESFTLRRVRYQEDDLIDLDDWKINDEGPTKVAYRSLMTSSDPGLISSCVFLISQSTRRQKAFIFFNDIQRTQSYYWCINLDLGFEIGVDSNQNCLLKPYLKKDHLLAISTEGEVQGRGRHAAFNCKVLELKKKVMKSGKIYLNDKFFSADHMVLDIDSKTDQTKTRENTEALQQQGPLIFKMVRLNASTTKKNNASFMEYAEVELDQEEGRGTRRKFQNRGRRLKGVPSFDSYPMQFFSIDRHLYAFIIDTRKKNLIVRQFGEEKLGRVKKEWKISLVGGEDTGLNFDFNLLQRRVEKGSEDFHLLKCELQQNKEEKDQLLEVIARVSMNSFVELPKKFNNYADIHLLASFTVPLGLVLDESLDDFIHKNPDLGYHCDLECFVAPRVPCGLMNRALANRDYPVVEIMNNVFLNVKENRLYERDFGSEVEGLWKELGAARQENVLDVLLRVASLGYEFSQLLDKLQVEKILEGLKKEGWREGINYVNFLK